MRASRLALTLCASIVLLACATAQIRVEILAELDSQTSNPSLSPDGKTLAFEWCKPDYSCAIYTRPIQGGEPKLLVPRDSHLHLPSYPRWSPDGRMLAFTRMYSHYGSHLLVMPSLGGDERDLGRICWDLAWSPDSRFLAAGVYKNETNVEDCRLILISVQSGRPVRQIAARGSAPAFSPDGRTLAFADDKNLKLVHLTAGYDVQGPAVTLVTEPRSVAAPSWSRDSKQLLYEVPGDSPYLRRLKLDVGAKPEWIPNLSSQLNISELLPDGSALATETTVEANLWRLDLEAHNARVEKAPDTTEAILSPDGLRSAYISDRTGVSQIWIANAEGTNPRLLAGSIPDFTGPRVPAAPFHLEWSPDSRWIAFTTFPIRGNADLRSWLYVVPASGGPLRRLGQGALSIAGPSWAPDGKSIFAFQSPGGFDSSPDQLVRIDLADGKITQITKEGGIWPHPSADGKFLYYSMPYRKLSRVPVAGGVEERLLTGNNYDLLWTVVGTKYLYVFNMLHDNSNPLASQLIRFDPETRETVTLATVPFRPKSAFLSRDRRYLYFEQVDEPKRRVVLVRGLLD
jgi:Tol biopolymer transport system component